MKAKNILNLALLTALISMTGCTKNSGVGGTASDATSTTLAANAQFAKARLCRQAHRQTIGCRRQCAV